MNHPLRCKCGTVTGCVSHPKKATRIVCYCRDCQSFARFLGNRDQILDGMGGTDIVAIHPGDVTFTQGLESIVCMSLTEKGLLRWYASCCNTPIGNTARSLKSPYVGLVHSCLEGSPEVLEDSFGPVRMLVNTASANGKPNSPRHSGIAAILRILWLMGRARLDGTYKNTPFFDSAGTPVASPIILARAERDKVRNAA